MTTIKVVCLGTKNFQDRVRCIELQNGTFIFPEYGKEPQWKTMDENHVSIEPEILISKQWIKMTPFECWGMLQSSTTVNQLDFSRILSVITVKVPEMCPIID